MVKRVILAMPVITISIYQNTVIIMSLVRELGIIDRLKMRIFHLRGLVIIRITRGLLNTMM
jgi:hypothetical protein